MRDDFELVENDFEKMTFLINKKYVGGNMWTIMVVGKTFKDSVVDLLDQGIASDDVRLNSYDVSCIGIKDKNLDKKKKINREAMESVIKDLTEE